MKHSKVLLISSMMIFAIVMAGAVHAANLDLNNPQISASLVNQNPDPAIAGQVVELRLMVENLGGSQANNVTVELQPSYPFTELPGESYVKTIGVLQGFQQDSDAAIVKFNVLVDKNAAAGSNKITFKITDGGLGISATQDLYVSVTGKQFAQIIYIDKYIISPGNQTSLTFTVNNVGSSPLTNMVFSWNDPAGVVLPVMADDTKYVKYLDVGASVDLQYQVAADVNAAPGLYPLNLDLKFDNGSGSTSEIKTIAGVFVGGETNFDVTYAESTTGTSFSVANTGNNPAYSVTVSIPQQDGITVTGSSSSIVGNLNKGDYTIATFQISSASQTGQGVQFNRGGNFTAPRNSTDGLKVDIEYTDTVGQRHTVEKTLVLQSSSFSNSTATSLRNRQSGSSTDIIIIIVVVVIVVGGYLFYRRRKKKSKIHVLHKGV